ncbi:MAG TPA: transglycosylase domain-containing protein [Candidatus Tidjanibacter faecipullorum]|uniref:Transglycosylase domain-containing protein n=1 Tax=Candidatus Tidjanibacter faecipullorum TaxID=2838766 RepID=A0A9D2ILI2_9BACT|nr:transglycosylase domain-containing protein [Candidatus Tidjanibacter faecipullorum]
MRKDQKTDERTGRVRRFTRWFWTILCIPAGALLLLVALTAAGAFGRLPSFEELENPKSNLATEIYAADGELIGSFYVQNRSYVDYEDLSPALVAALVSTEDARFYTHSGIDFISLSRVAIKTLALGRRDQGGGSTITQQLAKNLFPRDTTSYRNPLVRGGRMVVTKLKEWVTAVKLEYNYTKEEIIAMYLNTVFYGSNSYGIKAAARTFFDKDPSELNIQEAALLVGVVNAPTRYSPVRNPDLSLARRNVVMTRMKQQHYLTRHQLDSLEQLPIDLHFTPISHNDGVATYFREMIRNVMNMPRPTKRQYGRDYEAELERWESNPIYGWCHKNVKTDGTPYDIYRDGLRIYTTLDYDMQRYAEKALHDQLAALQPRMDAQVRRTGRIFNKITNEAAERIINSAMRYTDRYRSLVKQGATREEIENDFRTPTRMRIFTYDGMVDTLMSPRDSILHHKKIMRGSFMAMDPNTGYVKAYVGGPDFRFFKYDMVRQGKRHIGSTIKPFVYCFAIDYMGMTPCTMVPNLPVTLETDNMEPWQPKEAGRVVYDGVYHPLRWGLAHSRNNYSAWIMKQAKDPKAVADFIHQMGIHSYIDPVNALALGPVDVSLFEMVGAYGTFVNKGVFTEPIFITRIEDRQGNVIASFVPAVSDAISEQTAYTMVQMLQNNVRTGTGGRLRWMYGFSDVEMGGKTGTSQEGRDAWFMGVTPNLVAGTWVGCEDQSAYLLSGAEGASIALPVFAGFMKQVYEDPSCGVRRTDRFYRPAGAIEYDCPDSEAPDRMQDDEFFE